VRVALCEGGAMLHNTILYKLSPLLYFGSKLTESVATHIKLADPLVLF
jgi:hypothetical protein